MLNLNLSSFSNSLNSKGLEEKRELKMFSKPSRFFSGYFIVERKGEEFKLAKTHVFRILWERFKGGLGFFNGADPRFIGFKALEFLLKEKEWSHEAEYSSSIWAIAEQAGLFSCTDKSSAEEKTFVNEMSHALLLLEKQNGKSKLASHLLNEFSILYQKELKPFVKEVEKVKAFAAVFLLQQPAKLAWQKDISFEKDALIPLEVKPQVADDLSVLQEKFVNYQIKKLDPEGVVDRVNWHAILKTSAIFAIGMAGLTYAFLQVYRSAMSPNEFEYTNGKLDTNFTHSSFNNQLCTYDAFTRKTTCIKNKQLIDESSITDKYPINLFPMAPKTFEEIYPEITGEMVEAAKVFEEISNKKFDWDAYQKNPQIYIKKQYAKAALTVHPDKCKSKKDACSELFSQLTQAKELLAPRQIYRDLIEAMEQMRKDENHQVLIPAMFDKLLAKSKDSSLGHEQLFEFFRFCTKYEDPSQPRRCDKIVSRI